MENGSSLTIKDRLTHHAKAVLTAVEVATSESDKLIEGFRNFMTESRKTVKGEYKTYVLKSNQN
jgi:hypothetical protein